MKNIILTIVFIVFVSSMIIAADGNMVEIKEIPKELQGKWFCSFIIGEDGKKIVVNLIMATVEANKITMGKPMPKIVTITTYKDLNGRACYCIFFENHMEWRIQGKPNDWSIIVYGYNPETKRSTMLATIYIKVQK